MSEMLCARGDSKFNSTTTTRQKTRCSNKTTTRAGYLLADAHVRWSIDGVWRRGYFNGVPEHEHMSANPAHA